MGLGDLIYNSEDGTIFTRTPASWGKIGLFYLIYYTCLASFFAGLLAIFLYSFTDDKAPLLTGQRSVLPQNPGMGFRPMPDVEKTLIKYSVSDAKTYQPYVDAFEQFLQPNDSSINYREGQDSGLFRDCSNEALDRPAAWADLPCKFLVDDFPDVMEHCVNARYGYEEGTPCIAVKLNKVFEFSPELKNDTDVDFLKLECVGEHAADKDNIGPVEYFPQAGVNMTFFPYLGQKDYLSPLVFVKLQRPKKGVLIQVLCTPSNAANIEQDKMKRGDGRVTFEVLIDE